VQKNELEEYKTVSIQGSIRGLEERTYGTGAGEFNVTGYKYNNALDYFNSVTGIISARAVNIGSGHGLTINTIPLSQAIGHSPNQGTISYNYNYDTRPGFCLSGLGAAGLRSESIQIADTHPVDVFASLAILGRAKGPILQGFNTITEATRTVTIDILVDPAANCSFTGLNSTAVAKGSVDTLISGLRDEWKKTYDRIFTTVNAENWSPKTGRYSRTVAWVGTKCTGI
jgi:hypothetical protein